MRRVVVDGLNAYDHRMRDALQQLLEWVDGSTRKKSNYDFRPLREVMALWAKKEKR